MRGLISEALFKAGLNSGKYDTRSVRHYKGFFLYMITNTNAYILHHDYLYIHTSSLNIHVCTFIKYIGCICRYRFLNS